MAIDMIVEDGSVVTDANSFVSLTDADDILKINIHDYSTWEEATEDNKKACLIRATDLVDRYFKYYGYKTDEDSPLRWPRTNVKDYDHSIIDKNTIPKQLKKAVSRLALELLKKDVVNQTSRAGIKEMRVDVIEFTFDENHIEVPFSKDILQSMKTLGVYMGGSRRGFSKVVRA